MSFVQEDREDGEVRIVTDNLNEMCEFECLLCGLSLVESTLSKHLKGKRPLGFKIEKCQFPKKFEIYEKE